MATVIIAAIFEMFRIERPAGAADLLHHANAAGLNLEGPGGVRQIGHIRAQCPDRHTARLFVIVRPLVRVSDHSSGVTAAPG